MTDALVPHPAFDFTKYRPGDVVVLSKFDAMEMTPLQYSSMHNALALAAEHAGLGWTSSEDKVTGELRVEFFGPDLTRGHTR